MRIKLNDGQINDYDRDGFIAPLDLLNANEASAVRRKVLEHLSGSYKTGIYELTDEIRIKQVSPDHEIPNYAYEVDEGEVKLHTFPFIFNLWKTDKRFLDFGKAEKFAAIARQLLRTDNVLLFEDNVVIKAPHSKYLPWHQDYSYWPIGEPSALTFWFALDDISHANGAMELAVGSHRLGERLPVAFGSEKPFMTEARPGVLPVPQNPAAEGHQVHTYDFRPGQCGIHHGLTWHGSTANTSDKARFAMVLRYIAEGTLWLGDQRMPYDEIGVKSGTRLTREHFPLAGVV